jgi:hypothetical protein
MAVSTATSADAANKVLVVNGMGTGKLSDVAMGAILGGAFKSYERQAVSWPAQAGPLTGKKDLPLTESVSRGVANLDAALQSALQQLGPGEHVTVVGLSAGSLVVDEELRRLVASSTGPDKSKLNFVVVADPSRGGYNKNRYSGALQYQNLPAPVSKYDTTVVAAQYDGYADFPDRPNPVAVANALAGSQLLHIPSMLTNLSTVPASNVTTSTNAAGGVTKSYLIPTPTLPLVMLNPKLKSKEAQLRKTIDAAYSRNNPKVAATATAQAPAAAAAAPVSKRATVKAARAAAASRS